LKKLLHAEMERTDDPLLEEFGARFMKYREDPNP
jgi:hypothetical protein